MMDDSSHTLLNARLMRSALFVPGDKPRALDKADGLGADAIIIDLEDAVAPDRKAEARVNAKSVVPRLKTAGVYTVLRLAEPGSPDLAADLSVAADTRARRRPDRQDRNARAAGRGSQTARRSGV